MADSDPSDSSIPVPINRIKLLYEYGLYELVGVPTPAMEFGSVGRVVALDQPSGMIDIVPSLTRATCPVYDLVSLAWGPAYHCCYTLVRDQRNSGRTEDEIRSGLLPVIENAGALVDAVREALEDSLAGRPPKFKGPIDP